jgi:hypothetical protein
MVGRERRETAPDLWGMGEAAAEPVARPLSRDVRYEAEAPGEHHHRIGGQVGKCSRAPRSPTRDRCD